MSVNRLRLVLRANAAFSFVAGLIALVAASWVSRELGIDHVAITRLLGAGLVVFAIDILLITRSTDRRLMRDAALVSAADLTWVAATAIVVVSGVLSTTGNVVAVAQGLVVADFALAQLWLRSRAAAPAPVATVPV